MNFKYLLLLLASASLFGLSVDATEQQELRPLLLKAKALTFSTYPNKAILIYRQILSQDPNNAEAHAGLGWVYYQMGKPAQAITYEKQAISLDPLNSEPHYYLAAIYLSQKHYQSSDRERILAAKLAKDRPCNCAHVSDVSKLNQIRH